MKNTDLYFGDALLHQNPNSVSLETIDLNNETYFKIENYDQMTPFFMTIVSDVDFWLFISSTGGLTAGRQNPDNALFPYYTDDKIHDSSETTGSHTVCIVTKDDKSYLWKPFSKDTSVYKIRRNLYKNAIGNKIMFEEINQDLEVTYRYTWKTSDQFGFVKESELISNSDDTIHLKILDGIRNILPYGIDTLIQSSRSTLADGYKRCELKETLGLGIFTMSSIISDRAEPSESLKATTVWSKGLERPKYLLSEQQISEFCMNKEITTELDIKGRRGAYYLSDQFELQGHGKKSWMIVADLKQSATHIETLIERLNQNILEQVKLDIEKGDRNLKKLVFAADGLQLTANANMANRHFSNTLYNIMRGGIYIDDYNIDTDDLKHFIQKWNTEVYQRHLEFFDGLESIINYNDLVKISYSLNDADLERLVLEYLPLTYSRRHGDPSRPWNKFNIEIFKENGEKNLNFEGNWRDIFQNWEALSLSYPAYIESIISKFVNASTPDGYNPYRITKAGIDWEILDPEDPWSNIGYWGDHQIIYLLKLMELSQKYNTGKLEDLLSRNLFVYANVPYRIKSFDDLVKDPRNTITFDEVCGALVDQRSDALGCDGKLVFQNDQIYHVNLMEKLLVMLLSKLSNYVPEGGIWMNTQRPEWNDANNALVGNGISMVTLYYMHRFLEFMRDLLGDFDQKIQISSEVYKMFQETYKILKAFEKNLGETIEDQVRFQIVEALGRIGETYRQKVYQGFSGDKEELTISDLKAFIETAIMHLKDTIQKNQRQDGLYHAYNLISFKDKTCHISYLYEMLEGQVAALSSGALSSEETIAVLKALRKSRIYREDQNSYMLYPNRPLAEFLDKNIIPKDLVMSSKILKKELELKENRFIEMDIKGNYHFNGVFRNSEEITEAISKVDLYNPKDIEQVGEIFSDLFNHHAFTGRSGTFYKYEGLGCIYWHMVSKLVLSVEEIFYKEFDQNGLSENARILADFYHELKAGIGVDKSPLDYGAFPTDAYSHTPGFAGVQQPGMTGQVKEDIISRYGELGVHVKDGELCFTPVLIKRTEFLDQKKTWALPNELIELEKDQLAFTIASVPVIYTLGHEEMITINLKNGDAYKFEKLSKLDKTMSQKLFNREGLIEKISVTVNEKNIM